MKLWVDDMVPAPSGWIWVKSVNEAKGWLRGQQVTEASFDFDFGSPTCLKGSCWSDVKCVCDNSCRCPCHTAYPNGAHLLLWVIARGAWPQKLSLHTQNPIGRLRMQQLIDKYGPYGKNTPDPI